MIYLHVYYMFFNFVTFLYYLILNLCDNVFIFIMCTKVLGQVSARKITSPLPWIIAPQAIFPWMIALRIIVPWRIAPRIIALKEN